MIDVGLFALKISHSNIADFCFVIRNFNGGGMNTDDAPEYISPNDYIEAYNIRNTGTSGEESGYITNTESTEFITGTRAAGFNRCIGAAGFENVSKAYSFIYNSQGFHLITELDYATGLEKILFTNKTNSGGVDILPFNPQFYINDIKLIQGKFLAFLASNFFPCCINLERLKSGGYGVLTADDFSIAKALPLTIPTTVYNNDSSRSSNLLHGNLIQAISQYVRLDDEYSAWSSYSKRAVPSEESTPAIGTDVTKSNNLIISVDAGDKSVKTINVGARIGNLDFALIKSINRADAFALPNTAVDVANQIYEAYNPATNKYSFAFYNDGLYSNIDVLETELDYDHVPLIAGAMELLNGNILAFGDLQEGYPRPKIDVSFSVSSYDPGVAKPQATTDGLKIASVSQERLDAGIDRYTKITLNFTGTAKMGDKIKIVTCNLINVVYTDRPIEFTVPSEGNNNTLAAIQALATNPNMALYPVSVTSSGGTVTLVFTGRRKNETPDGGTEQLQNCIVDLINAGTGASVSKPVLKTNSAYQLALACKDTKGRNLPIATDSRYIIQTPSFAQLSGLTPKINWTINNPIAPNGAVKAQWLLSVNNTHQNTLWVTGALSTVTGSVSNNDYLVFNINPLKKFNENSSSSILTYDYTVGDRVTLVYKKEEAAITYYDRVDVEVVGFEAKAITTPAPATNYLLKVRKVPDTVLSVASLTGKNILLEIYTPLKRATTSTTGEIAYNETLFFEIGEQIDIVNGRFATLSGEIKEGDVYLKTRYLESAVADTASSYVVEDFNFSDFYPSRFNSYGRPRTYFDTPEGERKSSEICYSDTFNTGTKINGLTRFYPERRYGIGDDETKSNFGAIRKLRQRGSQLICIQETGVCYIPVYTSILEDATEQQNIAISDKLLNKARYNTTKVGMGNAKESYAEFDNNLYFIDPYRSEPIRIGLDGIKPISGKMSKHFKKTLQEVYKSGRKFIGYFDEFYKDYIIATENNSDVLISIPFALTNWNTINNFALTPTTITLGTPPLKGTVTYNNTTGKAVYKANAGQSGNDTFNFLFSVNSVPKSINACIKITSGSTLVNQFVFNDVTNQELSSVITSNSILITGNTIPSPISIVGGEYSVNSGAFTSANGFVNANDSIRVRLTSSALNADIKNATLTVGSVSDTFSVTTKLAIPQNFTVSPSYNTNITAITGSGIPAFTYPIVSNQSMVYSSVGIQTIIVSITTPGIPIRIIVYADGVAIATSLTINTAGTYELGIPSVISNPTLFRISIVSA